MIQKEKRGPGRPKGSTTKVQTLKNGNMIITMEKQIPNAPTTRPNSNGKWINWGQDNTFPQLLSDLYYTSSTHKSCIDFIVTAICGEEIITDNIMPNYGETWDAFIQKIALDLAIYGGYSFQIIQNKDGKTYSFYHTPFNNVRVGTKDEDGQISTLWVCNDWSNTAQNKPVELPRFGFTEDEKIEQGKSYMFYYKKYTVDSEYYPLPHYYSAIKAIQTESELVRYDLKSVLNNFSASGIISMDRIDDEDEKTRVMNGIKKMFTGSENSNTVMITFKDNDEEHPVTFTPFEKDSSNVNLFADNNERTVNRILSAHRISNPTLIGLPNGGTGFANEGQLLEASYNLLNKTLINGMRKEITNTINRMLHINGVDKDIVIKPLTFNLNSLDGNVQTDGPENGGATEYNNNNIEEAE